MPPPLPPPPPPPLFELEYTATGYLLIAADAASRYFPGDTLVLLMRGEELWLMPTRGAAAGGLLLKQRNPAGDRSLLAAPHLPEHLTPGHWPAYWDERAGALRAAPGMASDGESAAALEPGVAATAAVEPENGRWVVFLDVAFASSVGRRRIADYPTEQRARMAARWIERAADRPLRRPSSGFQT